MGKNHERQPKSLCQIWRFQRTIFGFKKWQKTCFCYFLDDVEAEKRLLSSPYNVYFQYESAADFMQSYPCKIMMLAQTYRYFFCFFPCLKERLYTKVTKNSNSNFSPQYWAYGLTQNSSLQKLLDHRIFLIRQSGVWSSEFNKVKQNLKQVSCSARQITARESKAC